MFQLKIKKIFLLNKLDHLKNEINQAKQVVMVDLYADWCVACKELEKYTFSDSRVSNILNQMKLIKFDITKITDINWQVKINLCQLTKMLQI